MKVNGLVVYGIRSGNCGLVVNRNVCWEGGKSGEQGSCYFRSSRGYRFPVEAAVKFESSVGGLVVLGNVAFLYCDGCVRGSFDMPCAEGAKGGELVISTYHGSVSKNVRCGRGIFVNGCHVHVLKSSACVSTECLSESACVVVVVKCPVSFCFSDPWPIPVQEGI